MQNVELWNVTALDSEELVNTDGGENIIHEWIRVANDYWFGGNPTGI
jgi:hypothetical protein